MRLAFALVGLGLFAAAAGKWLPYPWVWIGGVTTATAIAGALTATGSSRRALWANVAFALAISTAIESLYAWRVAEGLRQAAELRFENVYDTQPDAALGYVLTPSTERVATKWHGSQRVYRAHYTHGPDGFRITSTDPPHPGRPGVLFFGGSYMYGEGVDDEATLPFATSVALGGRYRAYNFGVNGWGPQQMLAVIENGTVARVLDGPPRYAVYMGIHDHLERAAGRADWLDSGPRYALGGTGVVPAPPIAERPAPRSSWLWRQLEKSQAFRQARSLDRFVAQRDVDLYAAIVAASRDALAERYPGIAFHVVFWDEPASPLSPRILHAFGRAGLRSHPASEILPDYRDVTDPTSPWRLALHDEHPSAEAFHRIAEYVAKQIVE